MVGSQPFCTSEEVIYFTQVSTWLPGRVFLLHNRMVFNIPSPVGGNYIPINQGNEIMNGFLIFFRWEKGSRSFQDSCFGLHIPLLRGNSRMFWKLCLKARDRTHIFFLSSLPFPSVAPKSAFFTCKIIQWIIHSPGTGKNRFGVWWAACCWLLCFLAPSFLNSRLNSCIFHLQKNCYQKTRQRIIVFCELTVKLLGFSEGPKAGNVQPGEMVCVREFISGGSFLLEERCLLRFLKNSFLTLS